MPDCQKLSRKGDSFPAMSHLHSHAARRTSNVTSIRFRKDSRMLVLTRKLGQQVVLPEQGITIDVVDLGKTRVRLGISAPSAVPVQHDAKCGAVGVNMDLDSRLDEVRAHRAFGDLQLQRAIRHAIVMADLPLPERKGSRRDRRREWE